MEFYEQAISKASVGKAVSMRRLRRWFEQTLITAEGTRGTVVRGNKKTSGIPNAAIAVLENERLVRSELRGGVRWYELSHDRLIDAIRESNSVWRLRNLKRISTSVSITVLLPGIVGLAYWIGSSQLLKPPAFAPPPVGTNFVILRIAGSNTIGERLGPVLARRFLFEQGATHVQNGPGGGPAERLVIGSFPEGEQPKAIEIHAYGSSTGFEALKAGKADIAMSCRRINAKEKSELATLGDMTSRASEHVLGLDGLAVIVHANNPVEALTVNQVRSILTGRIKDWSQVEGQPGEIHLYLADEESGSFDFLSAVVLQGKPMHAVLRKLISSSDIAQAVAQDTRGIGAVGLSFVSRCKALKISDGGSLPMRPTPFSIRTEDYIFSRRLYLYTSSSPKSPWAIRFVEFALSNRGQKILEDEKFVGQFLGGLGLSGPEHAEITNLPPNYEVLLSCAERLPFNIRFQAGGPELDNKAFRDLGRVVQYLSDEPYKGNNILDSPEGGCHNGA